MPDDERLLRQLARGDAETFERLYNAHYRQVRTFLSIYLNHNGAIADDLAQDTFLHLWRRPEEFDPGRSSIRTYLFGVARKKAADWWRRHAPGGEAGSDEPFDGSASGAFLMADALGRLDPQIRNILWLREVEGYSYDELAQILDIPVGTVKSRLFAAREQLRSVWKQVGKGVCDGVPGN